jgi:hypothetical protein
MTKTPIEKIADALQDIKGELEATGCAIWCILIALIFIAVASWRILDALEKAGYD